MQEAFDIERHTGNLKKIKNNLIINYIEVNEKWTLPKQPIIFYIYTHVVLSIFFL